MGWKHIKGHEYYYESRWEAGRARSVYRGGGTLGAVCAALDAEGRREAEARRAEARRWRAALLDAEREADGAFRRAEAVFLESMTASGFHRTNRGPWRRKRMSATATDADRKPLTHREAQALSRRLQDGDESTAPAVKAYLRNEGSAFLDLVGCPQRWAEEEVLKAWSNGSRLIAAASPIKFDKMRRELAGPDPDPLTRMLADRAVFCWFTLNALEWQQATKPDAGRTMAQAEFLDRRLSHAHRRFLSAVKALAVVRRLNASALTVTLSRTDAVTVTGAGSFPRTFDQKEGGRLEAPDPEPEGPT